MNPKSNDTDNLLLKWEESYKKGLLSFWVLLQLYRRPTYPFEMNGLIHELSLGTIRAEDNSIYRALKRFEEMGIVESALEPSDQGPDRRYYRLTDKGLILLKCFIQRNILVFQSKLVAEKMSEILSEEIVEEIIR